MIRIGFRAPASSWQGGRNYLWNLLYAIGHHATQTLAPVVLARTQADVDEYGALPHVEVIPPSKLLNGRASFFLGRTTKYLAGADVVERLALARAKVDLYSHAPPLGKRFGLPSVYWIPDLQHRRLPAQFSRRERWQRDAEMRDALETARLVIVSSHAAKQDALELLGDRAKPKLRVLQFVAQPRSPVPPPQHELTARYQLPPRFLFLPNQFWKHKNHAVVIEALAQVPEVHVVSSGATQDYRHPDHFTQLVERAQAIGVADRFRTLGAIPFADVVGLMAASVAVINPSLFEGWSTTVEEARTLGKRLVLSDIDVHREQAASRARFFAATSPDALAEALRATWSESDSLDATAAAEAARALPERTRQFAATYATIAYEALS